MALQRNIINYGALLRSMLMENTLLENGETVTVIVEQVHSPSKCLFHFGLYGKVVPEGWAIKVSRLTLAVIFTITPFLYQSSSVCYAHSQMQKRSMVYLFWTMGYSDKAVRNKTFNFK